MSAYKMPCRDLNSLNHIAKQACELFLAECNKAGLVVGVCETLRTAEYQNQLYQKGRTTSGSIVTNCDGYKNKSEHQSGMAFDFFQNIKGKEWDKSFYDKACPIAKKLGLDSGYYWTSFVDRPHITVPNDWKAPVENNLKVPQWQVSALHSVIDKLQLDKAYWTEEKLDDPITIGELMGLLNKAIK